LFTGTPPGNQTVHGGEKALILGLMALVLLDLCCDLGKLSVSPSDLLHLPSDLICSAKTGVGFGSRLEFGETDILATIPVQATV